MAPRGIAAALGLLAFSITAFAGLWAQNPVVVTLQRSLWALAVFCVIGLLVGWAGLTVVREHITARERERIGSTEADVATPNDEIAEQNSSTDREPKPMGT